MKVTKFKEKGIIINGDFFEIIEKFNKKVDMVLTDPPYNVLNTDWDTTVDTDSLISNILKVAQYKSAICIFAQDEFCHKLSVSGENYYRYEMFWIKKSGPSFVNCKYMPIKCAEQICVFSKSNIRGMNYFPHAILKGVKKTKKSNSNILTQVNCMGKEYESFTGYPKNVFIDIIPDKKDEIFHPTQKPVDLLRRLIRLYTREGNVVFDGFSGSASTACACIYENRKFVCVEKDEEYYEKSVKRIESAIKQKELYGEWI